MLVKSRIFVLLILGVFFATCGKKDCCITDPKDLFDRQSLLTNMVDNQLTPSYENFLTELKSLSNVIDGFTSNPSNESLAELKSIYISTYRVWQKAALFEGGSGSRWGPSSNLYLRRYVNTYPTKPIKIEEAISSKIYELETNFIIQGLPALDYILYGFDKDEVIRQFTDLSEAPNRIEFLNAVMEQMISKTSTIIQEWKDYRAAFIENDGTASNSSFAKVLNGFTEYYEQQIRKAKLGGPLGKFTQGVKRPQDIETLYSGRSQEMLAVANKAVLDFYLGKHYNSPSKGVSIYDYLEFTQVKGMDSGKFLSKDFDNRLTIVQQKLSNINGDFPEFITQDNIAMEEAYAAFQNAIVLLKVEIFAALGSSISYSDTDGD